MSESIFQLTPWMGFLDTQEIGERVGENVTNTDMDIPGTTDVVIWDKTYGDSNESVSVISGPINENGKLLPDGIGFSAMFGVAVAGFLVVIAVLGMLFDINLGD